MPMSGQGPRGQFQSYLDEKKIFAMQFGLLNPDEIALLSVAEIKSTQIYDHETFLPNFNAVNDPRMGSMEREITCVTCRADSSVCPGHVGHIALNAPVFQAGTLPYIIKFIRCVCFNCSKLLAPRGDSPKAKEDREILLKIKNLKQRFRKMLSLADNVHICDAETDGCGYKQPKFRRASGLKLEVEYRDENFDSMRDRKETLWPEQVWKVLSAISDEDCGMLGLNPKYTRPEWTIIKNLIVAPPCVRPSVAMGSGYRAEDDLTYSYQQILKMNAQLKEQKERGANETILAELKNVLQYYVATLMDNSIAGQPVHKHKSGKALKSVRSRLKGKEGRLRGNLMGKRSDFSSRTVITPDPNLALDEIGVPKQIAMNQTIPESVTPQNIEKLRLLVAVGPTNWPGAKYIIRHDGRQIDLSIMANRSDVHLEYGYKVERHLQDGDHVVINRQPSLHKMSIMGHRVKVLPFETFRLNLSVTTPYNADFDGDEMNMHVPQSYESMAEVKELMAVPKQIIAPKSNSPIMGIVQDSLLGGMLMTSRDCFVDKPTAMLLAMWIPDGLAKTLPTPAIIKPKPLWTGKQIFSLLLPWQVNLIRTRNKSQPHCCPQDTNVLIEGGQLLCGSLTKQIIGSTGGGLSHILFRELGSQICSNFLSSAQKLINNWLLEKGFTVGVQDIIVEPEHVQKIRETLQKFKRQVRQIVQKSQMGKLKSQPGKSMQESFEAQVNKKLNDARDRSGNLAIEGISSSNRLVSMVQAGSKGSNINISQIMACVGQQNVEGGRIRFGFNQRTLPHFAKDDFGPESRGFVESCYLGGLSPSELFFHAMGGREGLIDTAVKTAETGYISRRLIKAMEDIMTQYDGTVRSSKGEILQFLYGEDGMAGEAIEDMSIDLFKLSDKEVDAAVKFPQKNQSEAGDKKLAEALEPEILSAFDSDERIEMSMKRQYEGILADRETLRYEFFRNHCDESIHLPINISQLLWQAKAQHGITPRSRSNLRPDHAIQKLQHLQESLSVIPGAKQSGPLIIDADLNARRLLNMYMSYVLCAKKVIFKERLTVQAFDWLLAEIKSKFDQSVVQPGEMVGSIAAQSLGEPATQMTLNTFHFAGISAKNVTLGVPRFKEIINVNKNIKTPSLKVFLEPKYRKKEKLVTKLGSEIEFSTLSHVVAESAIYYDPDPERTLIKADEALVQLYNEVPVLEEQPEDQKQKPSPWVLRFELDPEKMVHKDLSLAQIDKKLSETFADQITVQVSDENCERLVVRCRVNNIEDDEDETVPMYLKNEFEPLILNQLQLKGFPEISKVTFSKYQAHDYCPETGKLLLSDDNWLIETDGTALAKILTKQKVDTTRTVSNDNLEILQVFGVEAARQSLVNEFRFVLGSYGIYVNYRHLATLVDLMTQRGKLMSITRSGINRVASSGPLRKCSFEETVEILLEGAMFSERDRLSGVTENIIVGQLAPFGSGGFDLSVDVKAIEEHAISIFGFNGQIEVFDDEHMTPETIQAPLTPFVGTPLYDVQSMGDATPGSSYTPHMTGGFSPAYPFTYGIPGSPQLQSPSPQYGISPQYAAGSAMYASPIYGASHLPSTKQLYQSPIYAASNNLQSVHGGGQFAANTQQSPNYGVAGAPPVYSPAYQVTSPSYQVQSPNLSSSMASASAGLKHVVSPSYSPSSPMQQQNPVQSPNYGASSSVNFGMKPHLGPSPSYSKGSLQSPCYTPQEMSAAGSKEVSASKLSMAPTYNPASPAYYDQIKEESKDESDD